jgi:hypothetical protein
LPVAIGVIELALTESSLMVIVTPIFWVLPGTAKLPTELKVPFLYVYVGGGGGGGVGFVTGAGAGAGAGAGDVAKVGFVVFVGAVGVAALIVGLGVEVVATVGVVVVATGLELLPGTDTCFIFDICGAGAFGVIVFSLASRPLTLPTIIARIAMVINPAATGFLRWGIFIVLNFYYYVLYQLL